MKRFMLHHKNQSQLFKRQLFCHAIDSRRQYILCMHAFVRLLLIVLRVGNVKNIPHLLVVTPVGNAKKL